MPVIICSNCNRRTNSTCSHYDYRGGTADYCYAAWDEENNRWIKGCQFDKADDFLKAFAMSLITGKPINLMAYNQ